MNATIYNANKSIDVLTYNDTNINFDLKFDDRCDMSYSLYMCYDVMA